MSNHGSRPSSLLAIAAASIIFSLGALASDATPPSRFAPEELGQDGRITMSPTFSPDGRTIYFAQAECSPIWECPQRLKRSMMTENGWSTPEPVALPGEGRVDWPSVTHDGRRLLFSWATQRSRHEGKDVGDDFDLYSLDLEDKEALPIPLDEPDINRIRGGVVSTLRFVHNETAPYLTAAGDLYFWTERLDGIGERDVYMAPSDGNGGFLAARPLPAPINSRQRDTLGWISPDGNLMLLALDGRGGSGGDDLFVSTRMADGWSEPENLGPVVNSPHAEFGARLSPDGQWLVFSSTRPFEGQAAGLIQVWQVPTSSVPALHSLPRGIEVSPVRGH
jgi:Tol biopolymer transport system component